jgi:ABC-type multidrug transport system ATPase subunit
VNVAPLVCSLFFSQTFRKEKGSYHTAVNHLSFGVTPAEIFGLLGTNGGDFFSPS